MIPKRYQNFRLNIAIKHSNQHSNSLAKFNNRHFQFTRINKMQLYHTLYRDRSNTFLGSTVLKSIRISRSNCWVLQQNCQQNSPFVLVAASAIFWKVSRNEPSARIVLLKCKSIKYQPGDQENWLNQFYSFHIIFH